MIRKNNFVSLLIILLAFAFITPASRFAQNAGSTNKTNRKKIKKVKKPSVSGKAKTTTEEDVYSTSDGRERNSPGGRKQDGDKGGKADIQTTRKAVQSDRNQEIINDQPTASKLTKAGTFNGDVRQLPYQKPVIQESPEREAPGEDEVYKGDPLPENPVTPLSPTAVAPSPSASFPGLDLTNWGGGYPPDTNGDVGPTYYIQSVNQSVGIYRKSDGVRVAAFGLNTFMSQGSFGNLCDSNNFGDPVVLYDSFEDRWIITDFAFTVDVSGNVTSNSYQCFAASKTGDPVAGGWNFYSTADADYLGDYPKFGVWTDGIYMSANMFGKAAGGAFAAVRVRALNKAQMYAGNSTVQTVSFDVGGGEFTILPANARLQTGTPPAGSPNFMSVVWLYLNAVSVYKFKVDWNKISTSTITGPSLSFAPASWGSAPASVATLSGNAIQTLQPRLMMQNQYTNIGGVESLWNSHTVVGTVVGQAAPRFYQVNVTGGTVAANTTQAFTHSPDNTVSRFMPSVAVDRAGDMALAYSASNSTMFPAIRYAGRLSTDAVNSLTQTENSLIEVTWTQTNNCVSSACTRWGDYSTTTLDPNGCTYWITNEYYAASGGNWQTRIGSFAFPSCTPLANNGTLQGTVLSTVTGLPINGATVTLGSRTATTNASGVYSFSNLPQGTYLAENATATGYDARSANNLAISDGTTTTQNFTLDTSAASACLTDTSQSDLQTGVPTNVDLTTAAGDAVLAAPTNLDQQNTSLGTSGVGITVTTYGGQTFTPAVSGQLLKADVNLFCSGCTGTAPNLTLSLRATSGGLPTGADVATATITGFNSGASGYYTGTFASPPTLVAGTQYALVIRPTANPSVGTYALTRSGTSTAGSDTYAGGTRVSGATSGTVWSIPTTGGVTTDAGFKTYMFNGYSAAGNLVSGTKDASPVASNTTTWTTISWTAATPANTSIKFQVAASNNANGTFNFVGPDGTAATFYTTSGASLSQFNGLRYLKYKAYLATTNSAVTPTLSDVTICYTNPRVWTGAVSSDWSNAANWTAGGIPGSNDRAIIPASGVTNNPTNTTNNTVGSLQLDSGIIDTGANTLTVSTCSPSAVTGGSATSYVKGTLIRCVDNTGVYAFPVGTTNGYSPVSLSGIVGSGNFTVTPNQAFLGGTNPAQSIQRNWGLTPSGGVTQANLTLTYLDADVPGGANESGFKFVRRAGTTNTEFTPTSSNTTTNTFTLNGVTAFSNWTLGNNSSPTAAGVFIGGRVTTASGRGIARAVLTMQAAGTNQVLTARTNSFGYYVFNDVPAGQDYVITVSSKTYTFAPRLLSVTGDSTEINFIATAPSALKNDDR